MRVYERVEQLIGNTPLMRVAAAGQDGCMADVLVKIEFFNPAASVKDRVAYAMIVDAENKGLLKSGGVIVEPTSGNTGIGLAAIGVPRGYRVILTMPDTMSQERIDILRAYGVEVVLTPGEKGMAGAIEKAQQLCKQLGAYQPGQFDNPVNALAHMHTTGPEIWRDTDGKVDAFVAGVGTGGTITGVGRFLKEKNPAVKIVAVEPSSSALLSGGKAGPHGLQGIGANFIPAVLDRKLLDQVIAVEEADAYAAGRMLTRRYGLLAGITSGAALHAALSMARDVHCTSKCIVALLPDTGMRYLSTPMFAQDAIKE